METKTEAVDIPSFFMSVNYRESVIVPRQISCHFSLSINIECAQLGSAICHPSGFCRNKYFLRTFDDENDSRNIKNRDPNFGGFASNTVLTLINKLRL